MEWVDCHGERGADGEILPHVKGTAGSSFRLSQAHNLHSWEHVIGPPSCDDAFTFLIDRSCRNEGDCMLLGAVDATVPNAKLSRSARSVCYVPRAGEIWAFESNRVVMRRHLPHPDCLFMRAEGSTVGVRVVDGRAGFRINNGPEHFLDDFELPAEVRPYARLGRAGDTVVLSSASRGRSERTSNDSVICDSPGRETGEQ